MSIYIDVEITREEALKMAKHELITKQIVLIDQALNFMADYELSAIINTDDHYHFFIEATGPKDLLLELLDDLPEDREEIKNTLKQVLDLEDL